MLLQPPSEKRPFSNSDKRWWRLRCVCLHRRERAWFRRVYDENMWDLQHSKTNTFEDLWRVLYFVRFCRRTLIITSEIVANVCVILFEGHIHTSACIKNVSWLKVSTLAHYSLWGTDFRSTLWVQSMDLYCEVQGPPWPLWAKGVGW